MEAHEIRENYGEKEGWGWVGGKRGAEDLWGYCEIVYHENDTLSDGTSPYRKYMGVLPTSQGEQETHVLMFNVKAMAFHCFDRNEN